MHQPAGAQSRSNFGGGSIGQFSPHRDESRLTKISRPPEWWAFDHHPSLLRTFKGSQIASRIIDHLNPTVDGITIQVDIDGEFGSLRIRMMTMSPYASDSRTAEAFNAYVSGKAAGRTARPPVPSEVAGALAQLRERPPGSIRIHRPSAVHRLESIRLIERAAKPDYEFIALRQEVTTDLESMRRELRVELTDDFPVEFHRAGGVDGIKAKLYSLAFEQVRFDIEPRLPHPVGVTDKRLCGFATDGIGVGYEPRTQQCIMNTARHHCGYGRVVKGLHRPIRTGKGN